METKLTVIQEQLIAAQLNDMTDAQVKALYDAFWDTESAVSKLHGTPLWSIVGGVFGMIECAADVRGVIEIAE
jgi:uncharacterized membrane protein YdcZ (DUF606 family)